MSLSSDPPTHFSHQPLRERLSWLAALIGLPVALSVLLITKIHYESFGRISDALSRNKRIRDILRSNSFVWVTTFLIGWFVSPRIAAEGPRVTSIFVAILCAIGLDLALSFSGAYPELLSEATALGERSWTAAFTQYLRDATQAPLVRHMADIALTTAILLINVVIARHESWLVTLLPATLVWLRFNALWQELVHVESHTRFLSPRRRSRSDLCRFGLKTLDWYSNWVTAQYFGMFPSWYRVEHIGIHHPRINSREDIESVTLHDRTSFLGFSIMLGRILANTFAGLGMYRYFRRCGRKRFLLDTATGALVHALTIIFSAYLCPQLALWLCFSSLGFSYTVTTIALCDHGLTDPEDPTDVYRNSYNVRYHPSECAQYGNKTHLLHHLRPVPTWGPAVTRMAQEAERTEFADRGVIVFNSFAYPDDLMRAYWRNDPDYLYPYVFLVGARRPSAEQWRELFYRRIRPTSCRPLSRFDQFLSRFAALLAADHVPPPHESL